MIFKTGDLFDHAKSGYILHQVNCQNAMGSGFARAFFSHYPMIKTSYHEESEKFRKDGRNILGHLQFVTLTPEIIGVNSFTQEYYGNSYKTGVKYTDESLLIRNIKKTIERAGKNRMNVYIPKYIGCGLGGGDWGTILSELDKTLTDALIIVGD